MRNKNILRIALATIIILLIPLIAMQFTSEVNWSIFDFIFMGILLFGSGLIYELAARKAKTTLQRVIIGIAVLIGFLLIWINAAT